MSKQKILVLTESDAIRLYPTADKTMKELLELNFGGKEFFSRKITDRIKNMSDIYSEMGIIESTFRNDLKYRTEKTNELALKIGFDKDELGDYPCFPIRDFEVYAIVHVLNEGWIPTKEKRRYFPYFSFSGSSGFDFSDAGYVIVSVNALSGFRLCLENEEKAKFAGITFLTEYKKYYCIK